MVDDREDGWELYGLFCNFLISHGKNYLDCFDLLFECHYNFDGLQYKIKLTITCYRFNVNVCSDTEKGDGN